MAKGSLKEVDDIVEESIWADWQNAKARGLKDALNFIQRSWAMKNGFKFIKISKNVLNKLLKGEVKTLEELENNKINVEQNEFSEEFTIFYIEKYNQEIEKYIATIDSIFINN